MNEAEFHKNFELEQRHWWFKGRRAVLRSMLNSFAIPSDSRILEVGCGTGGNLSMLGEYGQVEAMEYDTLALEFAKRKNPKLSILQGELPDRIPYEDETYDLVCAFDVLEHIQDDFKAVAALVRKLKSGGILFCTAPANQWMWSRHDEVNHHFRRYSLSNFEALFKQSGVNFVHASYYNTVLFPVIATVRLLGVGEDDGGSNLNQQGQVSNTILTHVFSLEKRFVPKFRMPFGVSVLCAVQKA